MTILFLTIFIISTTIHLYASQKKNRKLRNLTKPFILASLMGFYFFGAIRVLPAILLALFFSWVGDVLLMPQGVKWFTVGGISFMISHIFFIIGYCSDIDFTYRNMIIIAPIAALFIAIVIYIFSKLRTHLPKVLFYPMFLYLLLNGMMNCFAILRMISRPGLAPIITGIGAALFFISDAILFFVRFTKEGRAGSHFWVMLCYSLGELLIVIGLV